MKLAWSLESGVWSFETEELCPDRQALISPVLAPDSGLRTPDFFLQTPDSIGFSFDFGVNLSKIEPAADADPNTRPAWEPAQTTPGPSRSNKEVSRHARAPKFLPQGFHAD